MIIQTIEQQLKNAVYHIHPDFAGAISVTPARDIRFGDYSTNIAFALGKQAGRSPREIAEELASYAYESLAEIAVVSIPDGAPYINFTLTAAGWQKVVQSLIEAGEKIGSSNIRRGMEVVLEFISANPTGPLTLANGRGGFAGDAMANVLTHTGATVEREYYYNDSGNQILELGRSVLAARAGVEIEGGYKGPYVQELAQRIDEHDAYRAGQLAATYIFENWIKPMIARMGVAFTRFTSEQSLIDEHVVDEVMQLLKKEGLIFEAEGAVWLRTTLYGDDKDRVMRRTDGTYTYFAKDIAYHWHKIRRNPSQMITIVGADHFSEAKALDMVVRNVLKPVAEWEGEFRQPIIQFVRLLKNGQEVRMSKRAGNFVTIDDLLDEVNTDVARFLFLMRDLNTHMDFDLDVAREASDKNPVFYVQYAYVRAKHILEKHADEIVGPDKIDLSDTERQLMIQLLAFPQLVEEVAQSLQVHKLPHYAIDLARIFHAFYSEHPVLTAEAGQKHQRLALVQLTYRTLSQALGLMGVSQPDRMVA